MAIVTSATFVVFDGPGAMLWVISFAFAVSVDDVAAAVRAYERIPEGSVYKISATPAYQRQRDDYVGLGGC